MNVTKAMSYSIADKNSWFYQNDAIFFVQSNRNIYLWAYCLLPLVLDLYQNHFLT